MFLMKVSYIKYGVYLDASFLLRWSKLINQLAIIRWLTLILMMFRYEIPSSISGIIASMYEIGNVITVIFVSYLGSRRHIPIFIGVGEFILSTCGGTRLKALAISIIKKTEGLCWKLLYPCHHLLYSYSHPLCPCHLCYLHLLLQYRKDNYSLHINIPPRAGPKCWQMPLVGPLPPTIHRG